MVVAFPGTEFKGEIAPAIAELVDSGIVRVIDLAFVTKRDNGSIATFELEDLQPEAGAAFQTLQAVVGDLVSAEDLVAVGRSLEPNQSAALLVWEDVWATKLADSIRNAGGVLIDLERIPHETVMAAIEASSVKVE
jgi:hypothetical protein